MTYPTFDIPYDAAYSTKIEFNTQINEKMRGKEQRYPVWTYPKRTFTLSLNKNKADRQALEDFFVSVMGQAGKFYFVWDKDKGGDGRQYVCTFNSDSLAQTIQDYGFSSAQISFDCIDDSEVVHHDALDFYHNAECEHNISFYTLIDKVFTFRNERKSYWATPKKSWKLTFEKNAQNRRLLEEFFISKRGRFRSFEWVWDEERGGDGKTYNVRFDEDVLESDIFDYGFGKAEIRIKEVFKTENPLTEPQKDEIIPRKLLKIELEGGSVYIMDNETLENLKFNGEDYIGAPLTHGELKRDDNSSVDKLEIELSNVGLSFSGIIGARGDVITNAPAVLTLVFLNVNTNQILIDCTQVLFAGRCNNLELTYESAKMDIETELGGYEVQAPCMKYRPTCQVRRFKDIRCGYSGEETKCDRTFARCEELQNTANFRGFPSCVVETVIKV